MYISQDCPLFFFFFFASLYIFGATAKVQVLKVQILTKNSRKSDQ